MNEDIVYSVFPSAKYKRTRKLARKQICRYRNTYQFAWVVVLRYYLQSTMVRCMNLKNKDIESLVELKANTKDGAETVLGAIIGDIVGSRFEFDNHRSKEFDLFAEGCFATNETCQGTVPQAIEAFLESQSFEDAKGKSSYIS